ncbi:hypothetical protein TSUD_144400 [Trifolium subterraneum]|uniref:Uncharacterized protein n=1 Tax=Trifolium subterraneum TaxID=3900 RepID=A0A2Z6P4C0_TRISU|nr:hypothetical protein TSUD_144400 [Trifolium subterraneum]
MSSGFATDDQYNVYERGLFTAQPTLSTLYRPKKNLDNEAYGGADEQLEKIMKTDRFMPDKGFAGASAKGWVQGIGRLSLTAKKLIHLTNVKKGKKAMDNVGNGIVD